MSSDTAALQGWIARAIHSDTCEESLSDCLDPGWPGRCMRSAEATLPIIAAKVRAAKAEAWGECTTALITKAREHLKDTPGPESPEAEWADWRGWYYTWCAAMQHRTTSPYKENPR